MQTFTIPGCYFLTVIAGALFDFYTAIFLVSFVSYLYLLTLCSCHFAVCCNWCYKCVHAFISLWPPLGATLLSRQAKGVASKGLQFIMSRVSFLQVDKHRQHLFFYVIFLRLTPLVPNWFVNMSSPGEHWELTGSSILMLFCSRWSSVGPVLFWDFYRYDAMGFPLVTLTTFGLPTLASVGYTALMPFSACLSLFSQVCQSLQCFSCVRVLAFKNLLLSTTLLL